MIRLLSFVLLPVILGLSGSCVIHGAHPALQGLPSSMIWAWERAEDLRWLPDGVGVAYLAATIELSGRKALARPRRHPLLVRPETVRMPVIHVDALWHPSPRLTEKQREVILAHLLAAAENSTQKVVQLDFEARESQRAFFIELVRRARASLPRDVAFSVTALSSWCAGDYWLSELAADEVVPMAFRMGRDSEEVLHLLTRYRRFPRERCSVSIGSISDEPVLPVSTLRHYYFSPKPWTQEIWLQANAD